MINRSNECYFPACLLILQKIGEIVIYVIISRPPKEDKNMTSANKTKKFPNFMEWFNPVEENQNGCPECANELQELGKWQWCKECGYISH